MRSRTHLLRKISCCREGKVRKSSQNHGEETKGKDKIPSAYQYGNESKRPTMSRDEALCRRRPTRFTINENENLKMCVKKFGLYWSKILHNPELKFESCRFPNTLRNRWKF